MYLHFNEKCLKNFNDENHYDLGQAFNYSDFMINAKSKGNLNLVEMDLLRKLGISFLYFS